MSDVNYVGILEDRARERDRAERAEASAAKLAEALRLVFEWFPALAENSEIGSRCIGAECKPCDMNAPNGPTCSCGAPSLLECGRCELCRDVDIARAALAEYEGRK